MVLSCKLKAAAGSSIEQTYKNVLLLYIGQQSADNEALSATELSYLASVAEDCIIDVGFIVNTAKMLLPECYEYVECHQLPAIEQNNNGGEYIEPLESRAEDTETFSMKVYPNPTSKDLYIEYPMDRVKDLEIYNASGVSVYSMQMPEQQNLELDFPSGIYNLVLNLYDGTKESKRFVIIDK